MSTTKDFVKVHGQTISFRYFADKRLKAKPYFWQGKHLDSYPLYVEIKVKRQTSQRRSVIDAYVPVELLEEFLRDREKAIKTEVNALRDHILSHKPFENINFSLSHSLSGYSAIQESMPFLLGELLRDDYKKAREEDSINLMEQDSVYHIPELLSPDWHVDREEQTAIISRQARSIFNRGMVDQIIHPVAVFGEVRDLAVNDKPHVKALFERYGKHFWGIDRYCMLISENSKFKLISISTFLSQDFKKTFIEYLTRDSSQPIKVGEEIYNSIYEGLRQLKRDKSGNKKLDSLNL